MPDSKEEIARYKDNEMHDIFNRLKELDSEKLENIFKKQNDPIIEFSETINNLTKSIEKLQNSVNKIQENFDRIFGDHVLIESDWFRVRGIARDEEAIKNGHNFKR